MFTVGSERLRKQSILLQACKCDGVNGNEFIKYMKKVKGDTYDIIDAWDMVELKQAIEGFQQDQGVGKMLSDEENISSSKIEFQKNHQCNISVSFKKNIQEKYHREIVPCRKAPENLISNYFKENTKNILDVKINEFKVIDEGTFKPNYVKFKVEIPEFGWTVWRRYNDFYWLRDLLQTQFPSQLIPPVPKKTLQFGYYYNLKNPNRMFELFLATIINTPLLRTSDYLISFLTEPEDAKMQAVINTSVLVKKPLDISQYQSIDGTIILECSPFVDQFYINMTTYLEHTNEVYKRTTDSSRVLMESLEDVQIKMADLQQNVLSLKQLSLHFNEKNIIGNLGILPFSYTLIEEYIINSQKNVLNLIEMYKSSFYEFFRFQREMQVECLDLIQQRNKSQQQFNSCQKDLDEKKDKYFLTYPKVKWELGGEEEYDQTNIETDKELAFAHMFWNDQQTVNIQRDQFAFQNKYLLENLTEYFDTKGVIYTNRLLSTIRGKQEEMNEFQAQSETIALKLTDLTQMRNGYMPQQLQPEIIKSYIYNLSISALLGVQ